MFATELKSVQAAEEKAEKMQKDAKLEAKQIAFDAERKAAEVLTDSEMKAEQIYQEKIRIGEERAKAEYDAAMEERKKACGQMTEAALVNCEKAVNMISERIVKNIGNS